MRKRSQWGARPSRATLSRLRSPVDTVFVHHSVTVPTVNADTDIRNIQAYHLDGRKYSDIAYNLLVHPNGTIYQGRFIGDQPAVGAHTGGHNSSSFGICVIGNYETQEPDGRTLRALQSAVDLAVSKGWVKPGARIRSHSEVVQTACCGRFLREHLDRLSTDTRPVEPVKSVKGVKVKEIKTFLIEVSLDNAGDGWTKIPNQKWGRDPLIVGTSLHGPAPERDNYWYKDYRPLESAQAADGGAIVSVVGGQPRGRVGVWVTLGRP